MEGSWGGTEESNVDPGEMWLNCDGKNASIAVRKENFFVPRWS